MLHGESTSKYECKETFKTQLNAAQTKTEILDDLCSMLWNFSDGIIGNEIIIDL